MPAIHVQVYRGSCTVAGTWPWMVSLHTILLSLAHRTCAMKTAFAVRNDWACGIPLIGPGQSSCSQAVERGSRDRRFSRKLREQSCRPGHLLLRHLRSLPTTSSFPSSSPAPIPPPPLSVCHTTPMPMLHTQSVLLVSFTASLPCLVRHNASGPAYVEFE